MKETKNILLIGVGFHARRIYIPTLTNFSASMPIKLVAGVDVFSQKDSVDDYLRKEGLEIEMLYTHPLDANRDLCPEDRVALDLLIMRFNICSVVISTEPLAHFTYAKWALDNNLNILMDKPVSTRSRLTSDITEADGLMQDYETLLNLYKKQQAHKQTIFTINTQRRYDPGFNKVCELIQEARDIFNVPVTSIQAMYADGTWVLPNEILHQESHPYNLGYGICSHSGYHILDIAWQFYEAGTIETKRPDSMQTYSSFLSPAGFDVQITESDYKEYFGSTYEVSGLTREKYIETVRNYGEIDAFNIIRLLKNDINICNISINLLHNSFSRRAWAKPDADLYKGNGRVKHQQFIIQQGPFQSIHIHNYQANAEHDIDNSKEYELGGNNHFDIYVFRNSKMFASEIPFYKISSKELEADESTRLTTEKVKNIVILEYINFILGSEDKANLISNIESHLMPVKIMRSIYKSNSLFLEGKNPVVSDQLF
jgi:predicted dehydrogenase